MLEGAAWRPELVSVNHGCALVPFRAGLRAHDPAQRSTRKCLMGRSASFVFGELLDDILVAISLGVYGIVDGLVWEDSVHILQHGDRLKRI